ncbi:acetyltransferase [Chryseobacterium gallinarum]|uniref:acetyltransferase n=1 Tax=Chryseobacterium gallinarum TaxID=1324352 RepID=UPI002023DDC1|nr:acetyltransferase [Chryseobacterium gallinarum]MCL8535266.1 acetyltransferase [Chryseobacterium gallinarum]
MKNKTYLFGASGHGKVIVDVASSIGVVVNAFIDNDTKKIECYGLPVLNTVPENDGEFVISIGNNEARKKVAETIRNKSFIALIHSKAVISLSVKINKGTVVMAGVVINAETVIGKHCIINTNASIDHECCIEDFVHISPNAALAGNVVVREGTHIGIGASVIQGINIGKWCTIGAGAVIIKDVPDYSVVVGNPGRIIKKNNIK